jgi:hypothetical protein
VGKRRDSREQTEARIIELGRRHLVDHGAAGLSLRTIGAGTRVVGALFDAIAAGIATGDIRLTSDLAPQPMSSDFERIRHEFGFPGDDHVIAKCFLLWACLVGAISLEVFGQYGADTLTDPQELFDSQVRLLVGVLTQH